MNLYGFRIHTPWPNVEVWEWRRTRLTFLTVLTNRIVSMVRGTAQSTDTDCTFHLVSSYVERFRPVAFRNPSGVVTHVPAGQVMTTSLSDTLDFLLNRAVPYGDGLIDRYLREASAGTLTPAQLRERLGTLLWHGGRSSGFADCRSGGGTRLSRQLLDDAPITWYRTDAPWPFAAAVSIKHLDGPHLFPVDRWRYFVCPVEVPFADGVLPRTAWLRVDEQQQLRGWWDGPRASSPDVPLWYSHLKVPTWRSRTGSC